MPTEVKLELKKPLINYDNKPVKNADGIKEIQQRYPMLSLERLTDKCPDMTTGDGLIRTLLQNPTEDPVEKLKLFRWASKIKDKMITGKGELSLDINQITELCDFLEKVPTVSIILLAPILIRFDELKEELKSKP